MWFFFSPALQGNEVIVLSVVIAQTRQLSSIEIRSFSCVVTTRHRTSLEMSRHMFPSLPNWKHVVLKEGSDQPPALGLDSWKSRAALIVQRRRAHRRASSSSPQQEVHASWAHGVEDVSCGGYCQLCPLGKIKAEGIVLVSRSQWSAKVWSPRTKDKNKTRTKNYPSQFHSFFITTGN